jgi:hypothetical protein
MRELGLLEFVPLEIRIAQAVVPDLIGRLLPQIRVINDDRFRVLDRKLDAVIHASLIMVRFVQTYAESGGDIDMARLHDDLLNLANEVDAAADRVVAKTEAETSLQDVVARFEAIRDKLNAAADTNAADGGSTGGGSGSGVDPNTNVSGQVTGRR